MNILFKKYEGAGNDFIAIDNTNGDMSIDQVNIPLLCDRRFGIGADGLFFLELKEGIPFMNFFNNDGSSGIMCGNGARCAAQFAKQVLNLNNSFVLKTLQGDHDVVIEGDLVSLTMPFDGTPVNKNGFYISESVTAPHALVPVTDLFNIDIEAQAKPIRSTYNVNVNFFEPTERGLCVRTFERGVEGETLACGTGALAVAVLLDHFDIIKQESYKIIMPGGELEVSFLADASLVILRGPARLSFSGVWEK